MMLPSLSPMAVASSGSVGGALMFAAAYLLPWLAFGVGAYLLVEGVRALGIGFIAWGRGGEYITGGVLLGAGLYELTAAKRRCLRRCRDARLLRRRQGAGGAVLMGIEQGGFCVGCSGALMAALFALGVMSIAWMLMTAAFVAAEKLLPWPTITVGATTVALVVLGAAVVVAPGHVPWLTIPISM
jgi:predicted metal-binding membrane protein